MVILCSHFTATSAVRSGKEEGCPVLERGRLPGLGRSRCPARGEERLPGALLWPAREELSGEGEPHDKKTVQQERHQRRQNDEEVESICDHEENIEERKGLNHHKEMAHKKAGHQDVRQHGNDECSEKEKAQPDQK
ncbi:hypothetical protein Droror1_Dr00020555 [Drosera rotundifolia]